MRMPLQPNLDFVDKISWKHQCGLHEGVNIQHCLVSMIEKWKESVDNSLMTDLSKAFDYLHYELFITRLGGCGFYIISVKSIQQYLSNRKQRLK